MVTKTAASTSHEQQSDKQLEKIITDIHNYLQDCGHHGLLHAVKRAHHQKCYRSWSQISIHIDRFLDDPKNHYSLLMSVLELELKKFSQFSFYGKQLKALEDLFRRGYQFSQFKRFDL